jgi:hypothetical protein
MIGDKIRWLESRYRKNNITFGLQEKKDEGYLDTLGTVTKI